MWKRRFAYAGLALVLSVAVAGYAGLRNARADPIVRTATLGLIDWPESKPPITAVLLSDIHLGNHAMDAGRLERIVAQVDALHPDMILLAGDFIAGHEPADAAKTAKPLATALAGLHAPLGIVAVLGNHDHWTDSGAVRNALAAAHITVLENEAVARGPLALAGVGDAYTHHDRLVTAIAALRKQPGARIVLAHSPDIAPALPADATILLAGHTHCRQIVLPIYGALSIPSRYGTRYACGLVREGRRTTIVTAGVGTSVVPMRFGAAPDLWRLTLGPVSRPRPSPLSPPSAPAQGK